MDNIIVWDVNHEIDLEIARSFGIYWFDSAEIKYGNNVESLVRASPKKKVVLVNWWQYLSTVEDLSWADLIICITTELIHRPWDEFYKYTCEHFNNSNIIFIAGGKLMTDNIPSDIVLTPNLSFFTRVARANNPVKYDTSKDRPYMFDALFGSKSKYRVDVFNELKKRNLLDQCIVNLEDGKFSKNFDTPNYRSAILDVIEDPEMKIFRSKFDSENKIHTANNVTVKFKGTKRNCWASQIVPVEIYKNSWYSIVNETSPVDFLFPTEKTGKCLYAHRIFVCFASPGHLKLLREQGYKTFSDIIDESYDLELNYEKRKLMVLEQIEILAKSNPIHLYEKVKPILIHNFNLINSTMQLDKCKIFIEQHLNRLK